MGKKVQFLLFFLLLLASIAALTFAFLYEKKAPNPLLDRIKPFKDSFLILPDSIKNEAGQDLLALIVLEDLSCPLCLNEAVDFIDFFSEVENVEVAVWYTNSNKKRVENYHASIDRKIPYSYGQLSLNTPDIVTITNSVFFVSNDLSIVSSIPLSNQVTSRELKKMILKKVFTLN